MTEIHLRVTAVVCRRELASRPARRPIILASISSWMKICRNFWYCWQGKASDADGIRDQKRSR
ncbi:hypothetical protein RA27_17270 [Ruegeria sp. ANG-R]|nr:hypothetical protein RA27_17270 [Ruegeria sp. ANG-R]